MWYHLQSPGGVLLTFVLLHFIWQAILVYCLGRLGATLLPLRTAEARYRWALGTLAVMLLCPLATFLLMDERNLPLPAANVVLQASLDASPGSAGPSSAGTPSAEPAVFEAGFSYRLLLFLQPYLMLGWIGGVLILALRLTIGYGGTVWLRRVGLTPVDSQLRIRFVQLSDALRLPLVPGFAFSRQVSQAMTVGLLRPMVLLPAAWLTQLTPEIVEAVIAHELAHIRRQDLWINILQRIAETLFFYHPAVWWISSDIRRERELCCDELAIATTGKRLAYAKSLEQVANWQEARAPLLASPFLGDRKNLLLGRVQRILGLVAPDTPHRFSPVYVVLVATAIGLTAAALTVLPAAWVQAQPINLPDAAPSEQTNPSAPSKPPAPLGLSPAGDPPVPPSAGLEDGEVVLMETILDLQQEVRLLQRKVRRLRNNRLHHPHPGPPPHGPPPHGRPPHDGHRPPPHPHGGPPGHHRPGPPFFPPPHAR